MTTQLNAAQRLTTAADKPYDSEEVSQILGEAKDSLIRAIQKCENAEKLALVSSKDDLKKLVKSLSASLKELRHIEEDV